MSLTIGLGVYVLIGAVTGLGLCFVPGNFSTKDQLIAAVTWPLTWVTFSYGFLKSLFRNEN